MGIRYALLKKAEIVDGHKGISGYSLNVPAEKLTLLQIYQAVAYSVKDDIIDNWIETHKAYEKQDKKMVYYKLGVKL